MKGGTHVSRHSSRCVFWCSIETLHLFYDRFSASRTQNDDNRLYWATRAELIPRCDSELRQAVWCRAEVSNFFWCKMCYALRKHNDTLIINLQKTERSTLWWNSDLISLRKQCRRSRSYGLQEGFSFF